MAFEADLQQATDIDPDIAIKAAAATLVIQCDNPSDNSATVFDDCPCRGEDFGPPVRIDVSGGDCASGRLEGKGVRAGASGG